MTLKRMQLASYLLLFTLSNAAIEALTPFRMSYDDLTASSATTSATLNLEFEQALTTDGMVSITGLSTAVKKAYATMIATQHSCLMDAPKRQEQTFPDGALRRTVAAETSRAGGIQPLEAAASSSEACEAFHAASFMVRTTTQNAVQAFAQRVTEVLEVSSDTPMLVAASDTMNDTDKEPLKLSTFADVVENGVYLEHFHSYQQVQSTHKEGYPTMNVHTDQGLFLVFTPGRLSNGETTQGLYIQTAQGDLEEFAFDAQDDLVFMLGDGVNQFVNSKVVGNKKLRAVPHALQLEVLSDDQQARVWYGLMVLPPSLAVHPAAHKDGITFGQIRQGLVQGDQNVLHLACSDDTDHSEFQFSAVSPSASSSNHRWLQVEHQEKAPLLTCNSSLEVFCWGSCMNATEFSVSPETCQGQGGGMELKCVSPRGEVSDGTTWGDFYPGCASPNAPNESAFPTLPEYPRNDASCTNFAQTYEAYPDYEYTVTLPDGNGALFQYTLNGESLKARLAFNGLFGFLSVGFIGPQAFTMYEGKIILAMRGGNYTPENGLDLDLENEIGEYIMDATNYDFRTWSTPYTDASLGDSDSSTTTSGAGRKLDNQASFAVKQSDDYCYTSLTFEVQSIAGQKFNLTGTDTFLWAANKVDTHMQWHWKDRGVFAINWLNQSATANLTVAPPMTTATANPPTSSTTPSTSSGTMLRTASGVVLLALFGLVLM
jgi:hypothetical protein